MSKVRVQSPNVRYVDNIIESKYQYSTTRCTTASDGTVQCEPLCTELLFRTDTRVPERLGVMMVGWGGNNGSTVTASILANKHKMKWLTRIGEQNANYFGSITQASTVRLGFCSETGKDIFVPLTSVVPMANPDNFVLGGWDISKANLAEAMYRAHVLEPDLMRQVEGEMKGMIPLPSIYYPDFIAANQKDRADNVLPGQNKQEHLDRIRADIRKFKADNKLDRVTVCWTANTERFADIIPGVNDTADNLLKSIRESHSEISPSTIFAVACILEHVPFINGSPQNTFVPGAVQLAEREKSFIAGDDFKSGQTKMKSVLVDFLVNAGIKPLSIASYNHLGNNDGKNLSAPAQFRSKEISKSNVVDDMVASNKILYHEEEHPDHLVVIKYMPSVGDSKRALDEYYCEIFMGGRQTIAMHNTCEDSLLAAPLIIDLCVLAELHTRLQVSKADGTALEFHPIMSLLSYLLKAPMVKPGTPVVNSLARQRTALENVFRALIGLPPGNEMCFEHRFATSPFATVAAAQHAAHHPSKEQQEKEHKERQQEP